MIGLLQTPFFWLVLAIIFNVGHTLFHVAFYQGYKGKNAVLYDGAVGYLGALFVIILCFTSRGTIEVSNLVALPMGVIIGVIGIVLHVKAQLDFKKYGKELLKMHDGNLKLIDKGIYRFFKHPMYLGGALAFIGVTIFFRSYLGLVTVWFWILLVAICGYLEELELRNKLPDGKYDEYAMSTWF